MAPTAAGTPRRFGALSESSYRFFFAGYGISYILYWVYVLSLGWFAWESTHSALWLGVIYACDLCPALVVSPIGGALADRLDRLTLLRTALWLQVANALTIAALAWLGWLDVWLLALLALAEGTLVGISQPAFNGLVPRLVSRSNLASAIALNTLVYHLSGVLGPLLAGAIFAFGLGGAPLAFVCNAVGTLLYLACLSRVRFAPPPTSQASRPAAHIWHDIADGFRYMARSDYILVACGLTLALALLGRTLTNLLPGLNDRYGLFEPARFVWLTAALLIGSVMAALLKASANDLTRAAGSSLRHFLLYALLWSLAFGLLWVGWADPWLLMPLLCLLGFTSTTAQVSRSASLQAELDETRRGRVMGNIQMLSRGAGALGALLAGALADYLDFAPALLLLLVLALALFLGSLLLARARRTEAV